MEWFTVDKAGMAKVLARRSIAHALLELVQNALDEPGTSRVDVEIRPEQGRPYATVTVTDNAPEGFKRISDAWTMFAESWKKGDATKRGRFNIGEKLVLALATEAKIVTTSGTVVFDAAGRHRKRGKTEYGSVVRVRLRMTRQDVADLRVALRRLITPRDVVVAADGQVIPRPIAVASQDVILPTEIADEDGNLRPTARKTTIDVYNPLDDTGAWLYEMGIPVVRIPTPWSVDVLQRIPLNLDRDNVSPAYQRRIYAALLNAMWDEFTRSPEARGFGADEPWVREAAAAPECEPAAFEAVLSARFGDDRVMADPSDREAGNRAIANGYRVVYGNQLNKGERKNLRRLRESGRDPLVPAGRTGFRTTKPYSDDPNAEPVKVIQEEEWTSGMRRAVHYARHVAVVLGIVPNSPALAVRIVHTTNSFRACYGPRADGGALDLNLKRLGHSFFDRVDASALQKVHDLLIHEYGHHFESNHLSADYHRALTQLGAQLTRCALEGRLRPTDHGYDSAKAGWDADWTEDEWYEHRRRMADARGGSK